MSALQPTLTTPPHQNRRLFSDHYLDVLLPGTPEWRAGTEEAAQVLAEVRQVFARFTPSNNEAQTEQHLVRPVLELLGHTYEVQPSLQVPGTAQRPDYILYRDAASRAANAGLTLTDARLQAGGLAVADAKYWDRPLDQALRVGSDPFTNKNPGYQIAFYVQHTGLPWGLLTNGRQWRLYHRDTAHKLDTYYEVDLPALLERGDGAAFQYFLRFFNRSAFQEGPFSLQRHLEATATYSRSVSDSLREQVYLALQHVAQGFLDYPRNGLSPDPDTLKQIYDHALILLYRLLFILYAEARGLLPVEESDGYRDDYSLAAIKQTVAKHLKVGRGLLPTSATLWPRLQSLFEIINLGSPPLKVATFNGGLFDPERHPFLERYAVGDFHLQQAIDRLARVEGEFVDYRDLSERHLGTIYEGLLEFHLQPLPAAAEADADDRQALRDGWRVKLVTDKGERKASGSYYTPGFITRFMVEQAIGPVVEAALRRTEGEPPEARAQAVLHINVLDCSMGSGHFLVEAVEYLARKLVEADLLPATMRSPGASGRYGAASSQGSPSSGAAVLSDICHSNMTPPQSGELQFDELAYWKRRVAQSSVYGVDLNPLAVDLAKLSLWLITAAKDRPLSFLDHHLRPGNALVGARLNDLTPAFMRKKKAGAALATEPEKPAKRRTASKLDRREKIGQLTFAADSSFIQQTKLAVGNMWLIEESAATTVAEVKQQEKLYAASREAFIRKYSRLADLVTATYFGLEVDESLWTPLADFASGRTITTLPKLQQWLEQADALAEQYRYFHWELEFPEVFFDRFGRPLGEEAGFDVVVGNPPYVRQELLAPFKPYFQTHFASYHGVADLYVYFYERGYGLLQQGGRMSYIVTNKWMRAGYGAPLRSFFADSGALERIIDFGHAPIFADADVFPCILVLERPTADAERQVHITEFPREALHRVDLDRYVRENRHQVPHHRFTAASWSLEPAAVDDLIQRIRVAGQPLLEVVGGKPFRGIMTGLNEAFLIDAATKERLVRLDANAQAIIRPYLRGQDIKRWVPSWQQLWMIVLRSSGDHAWPWSAVEDPEVVFAATYPSIYAHLKPLEDKLRKRQDKGRNWWELRSCAYYDTFEKAKLVYQEIQFHPSYCLDTTGFFSNNKVFMLPTEDRYLLAVLNSPLIWWYNWRYLPHMKDEALSPLGELMERLPIAQPTEQIREQVEPRVDQLLALTAQSRQTANDFIDWLRVEFGVESPSQKLLAFATLEQTAFLDEVRKGRPKSASRLSPAALREVREAFDRYGPEIQGLERERQTLEGRVSDLVNAAYGLTEVELTVLWGTAPPRMPGGRH